MTEKPSSVMARFCIVLTVLPAACTFFFLHQQIQAANLCFVKDVSGGQENLEGIYRQRQEGFSYFSREAPLASSWSSIAEMGRVLSPPVRSDKSMTWSLLAAIADLSANDRGPELNRRGGKWCLEPGNVCFAEKGGRQRPSEGVYGNGTISLRVACRDIESIDVDGSNKSHKRRGQAKLSEKDKEFLEGAGGEFVANRPASAMLVAVMLYFAYRCNNQKIRPEQMAFSYNSIVVRWEFWRAFTGSISHFDPIHLTANMYSLYTLGSELEESYGSIPFLMYNIALIPVTVLLTVLLVRAKGGDLRRPLVGYSGVIFAWSTVAASRLPISWPFHFGDATKNLYFRTITIGPMKLNPSPFVRMAVIDMLVPNTSLDGHLAGILCGLVMQLGCFPLSIARPEVLIPSILWCHFYIVRKTISFDAIEQVVLENPNSGALREHRRVLRVCRLLLTVLVAVGLVGCALLEWSMSLQLAWLVLFLHACIMNHTEDVRRSGDGWKEFHRKKRRSLMLWKAFLLTCFLSVLSDSMAFGGWMSCHSFWFSDQYSRFRHWSAGIIMVLRIVLQNAAFAVAAKRFLDLNPDPDIFFQLFHPFHLRDGTTVGVLLTNMLAE